MEEKIRANIKKFREEAGLTQKALADRSRVTRAEKQIFL